MTYYTNIVQFDDEGNDVLFLQRMLRLVDCDPGALDADFGNATLAAVKEFQADCGLTVDGICGANTWEKLYNRVAEIQTALNKFGYKLTVDGNVGSSGTATIQALQNFQSKNGLDTDWICGPATSAKLGIKATGKSAVAAQTANTAVAKSPTVKTGSFVGKKFYISQGHGGSDGGASGNGLTESHITLDLGFKVGALLQAKGATVMLSRSGDYYKSLNSRTSEANSWGADYFVSIHENAFSDTSANGTEVWYYAGSTVGTKMASSVCNSLVSTLGSTKRGIKTGDLWEINQTNMPAILCEGLFITNPTDASKMDSDADLHKQAVAIVNGLINALA